jgi:glycosyltransferase involved in cell wall biosynthesis
VFNELGLIQSTVGKLKFFLNRAGIDYEIIICDDASNHAHDSEASTSIDLDSRTLYLRFHKRLGKGGTIKNGLRVASGDVILILDADLPIDVNEIPWMINAALAGYVAIGVRGAKGRATQKFTRRLLSHVYNSLVELLFSTGIEDHQCGFKAVPSVMATRVFPWIRCDGFAFDTELIVNSKRLGIPVISIPITWREPRKFDSKVIPFNTGMSMLVDLVILRLINISGKSILRLKQVEDGFFTCENTMTTFAIERTGVDSNGRFLKLLRKIYFAIAFGGSS